MSHNRPELDAAAVRTASDELARDAGTITAAAANEATLRHQLQKRLQNACEDLGIPWTPFQLDLTLRQSGGLTRFADVAHGAVVIEYEPPSSFAGTEGAVFRHAQDQVEEYGELLSQEEGRPLHEYVLVVFDGADIAFGRFEDGDPNWERLRPFDASAAERLLRHLNEDGVPLVHPLLLTDVAGPSSDLGRRVVPLLFDAVVDAMRASATTTKTSLLFVEWRRLFGQTAGVQSDRLREFLASQGDLHGRNYEEHPDAYLFALYTYLALVAKLVAALSLEGASERLEDSAVPLGERIEALESGRLFAGAGITNMLNGDFFSWYRDDASWVQLEVEVGSVIDRLGGISFDVARKTPDSTRDLFKGLYQTFVPSALRHALGEFYTPDWLADHALTEMGYDATEALVDPSCGSGTFLLEALKRRMLLDDFQESSATEILDGLYGLDLNPLAVLCARASLVVFLSERIRPEDKVRLPIFLADAVNPAHPAGQSYTHSLQTEQGVVSFTVPASLVAHEEFFALFQRVRNLIDADTSASALLSAVLSEFQLEGLDDSEVAALEETIIALVQLHELEWNGIWCSILADRFAAGAIGPVPFVAGNPPWVKWSNLPPEYAAFIKPTCLELGVFSSDSWVGGIESDISTVITYESIRSRLAPGGTLGFFITGTVFANESSEGFRRWEVPDSDITVAVQHVEDFAAISPFEGVANHPTLLILKRQGRTHYPVPYFQWDAVRDARGRPRREFTSADEFMASATGLELQARPVPGTEAGPWLKGTEADHDIWSHIFRGEDDPAFRARKGITSDANGVFWVKVEPGQAGAAVVVVENDPDLGRRRGLARVKAPVEARHLFPLLRGRGMTSFHATPETEYMFLVPQRTMHGDPELPINSPATYEFLARFESVLESRSSLRRYQRGKPYWSLWSTGPYSFADYKVVWKEMSGGRFAAAYVGPVEHPLLGTCPVICDHKLYFVPCDGEAEAAYLTAVLNAPTIAGGISAYAAQLSLGVSVVEYLAVPSFDATNDLHRRLADLGIALSNGTVPVDSRSLTRLDDLAKTLFAITAP
jgi:hypothetical protein